MIEFKKSFVYLQFYLLYCILNIVPISDYFDCGGSSHQVKRREQKISAFLKIRQNMKFFTGLCNILYLHLSSTILRDTNYSMTGSAKHVSTLHALFRTLEYMA